MAATLSLSLLPSAPQLRAGTAFRAQLTPPRQQRQAAGLAGGRPPAAASRLCVRAAGGAGGDAEGGLAKQLAETAALDQLIDALQAARGAEELAKLVGENIMSFDTAFWLRLAARADAAADEETRGALASLARHVQSLVEAMVARTQQQMDSSAALLQEVLRAGADPTTGEWALPLAPERLAAMRGVLAANEAALDDALLSTCYAWIRKADQDKLDGMVSLLQKVLQLYASHQLAQQPAAAAEVGGDGGTDQLLAVLLGEDERVELALMEALQRRMEAVVLSLASGSYGQRVQAEYLKEVEDRAKEVFASLGSGSSA
eukprot:scaffold1.g5541.t1